MQLEVPNLMENELQKQMEDDLRRLLAGTDIRANGTAITADSWMPISRTYLVATSMSIKVMVPSSLL